MKKYAIALLILLLACPVWARSTNVVVSSGVSLPTDPCGSLTSTYMFVYTGDYSADT